jgi:RNA-directed DNA polymerase
VQSTKAPAGTRDEEQSGRGAAIICVVYGPSDRSDLAQELARAFLDGAWTAVEVAERGAGCLDRWPRWMSALAMRAVAVHRAPPTGRPDELVGLIETFLAERPAPTGDPKPPLILRRLVAVHRPLDHSWPIAAIESVDALAERLELSDGQLAWLADVRGLERTVTDEKLRNYRYHTVHRRNGLPRVIEAPKARVKEVQRWLLHEILDHVPAHDSAHGFVRGRSVLTHAGLHTGQAAVLRLDLRDFFASIAAGRVYGIFRTGGYAPAVAHVLTGLCTNTVPQAIWHTIPRSADPRLVQARFWLGRQLATPHLPQGAPSSPALANLAAFRLDRRLSALAASLGLRYSRYADDLTFSGPRHLRLRRAQVQDLVATITREEGFALNTGKTSLTSAARRQSVCGVVVNVHPNVTRAEYDRLKAILHNVARYGAASQNRAGVSDLKAHLRGRIAWVASLEPNRGAKLRRRFAEISWGDASE